MSDASDAAPDHSSAFAPTVSSDPRLERLIIRSALRVIGITGVCLVLVLLAWRLRALVLILALAVFVAMLLNPLVVMLMRRGPSRTPAALIVYLVLVVIVAALGYGFGHPLYVSATAFSHDLPHLVNQAEHGTGQVGSVIKRLHLGNYVSSHAHDLSGALTRLGKPALAIGKTVVGGVATLVTIAFISFFLIVEAPGIFEGALTWMPERRAERIRRLAKATSRQVTGFMLGNFATSVVAGIVVFIALRVTGVPFSGVLALWVALIDFLPLVGGLLAGIPAVGVAFLHSVPAGIVTIIVFLVYQQVENHILYPIVISRTVRLNPLLVLLSVLIGAEVGNVIGSIFGAICGAIIAVPVAGALHIISRDFLDARVAARSGREVAK